MIDDFPHHRPACPGGELKTRVETAGTRTQCTGCKAYWRVPHADSPSVTTTPTLATRTVCREHHTPVTAQGKGCTSCAADRQASQKRKRTKRTKAIT